DSDAPPHHPAGGNRAIAVDAWPGNVGSGAIWVQERSMVPELFVLWGAQRSHGSCGSEPPARGSDRGSVSRCRRAAHARCADAPRSWSAMADELDAPLEVPAS